jgi:hypothetical protein
VTPYKVGGLCVPEARGSPGGKPPGTLINLSFLHDASVSSWHPG